MLGTAHLILPVSEVVAFCEALQKVTFNVPLGREKFPVNDRTGTSTFPVMVTLYVQVTLPVPFK